MYHRGFCSILSAVTMFTNPASHLFSIPIHFECILCEIGVRFHLNIIVISIGFSCLFTVISRSSKSCMQHINLSFFFLFLSDSVTFLK